MGIIPEEYEAINATKRTIRRLLVEKVGKAQNSARDGKHERFLRQ
jgi:hypothetical protein